MMFQLFVWLLLSLQTAAVQTQPEPASVNLTDLETVIRRAREEWQVPGLAVAVVHNGQVVLASGYGVRELGQSAEVDADTLFAIASNTKAFTATALAILAEEKRIQWDDRVQQHLPWLQLYDPWVSAELRVDDLLCHRSGLDTFSGDLLWWGTPYAPEEVLRRARHLKPAGSFRSTYGYSNLMFLAAGEVIATASGTAWPTFVKERILTPLNMNRTVTSVRDLAALENVATPHKPYPDRVVAIPWYNWDTMAAAGGLISSVNDMARWLQVQLDRGRIDDQRRLFSEASARRMWTPHMLMPFSHAAQQRFPETHFRAYGLGWVLSDYKGRLTASHGGGYDGMYSHVLLVPEERLGIVVLTNSMTGLPSSLTQHIMDEYLGGRRTDWLKEDLQRDVRNRAAFYDRIRETTTPRAENTQPSRELAAYAGQFTCPLYGDATVTQEGDGLVLRLLPNPELVADLRHLHYDTWVVQWRKEFAWFGEGTVQFVPDARGEFQQLRLDIPNDDLWFHELNLQRTAAADRR